MWLLGTSVALELPPFLLFSLCATLFFPPAAALLLYFRFSIHDPRVREGNLQTMRLVSAIFHGRFHSARRYLFLNDTLPSGEDRLPKKELIRAMKIKNPSLVVWTQLHLRLGYYVFKLSLSPRHFKRANSVIFLSFSALRLILSPPVKSRTFMKNNVNVKLSLSLARRSRRSYPEALTFESGTAPRGADSIYADSTLLITRTRK